MDLIDFDSQMQNIVNQCKNNQLLTKTIEYRFAKVNTVQN